MRSRASFNDGKLFIVTLALCLHLREGIDAACREVQDPIHPLERLIVEPVLKPRLRGREIGFSWPKKKKKSSRPACV
jgi:hypothetical protein